MHTFAGMKILFTIGLLVVSNAFMTVAWYGHLRSHSAAPLVTVILLSWAIALPEYCFQVPANRIGFVGNGGPFTLFQLKIIQEALSLIVFTVFALTVFKTEMFRVNHLISFALIMLAVWFAFKK
jgi:uncharacterized protein (DUF486 family)